MGRIIAKGSPSSEYVAKIESTPVCGVEIRNETVAPFPAPLLCMDIPVGITPQEHKGMGIPINEAFVTERKLFFFRFLVMNF